MFKKRSKDLTDPRPQDVEFSIHCSALGCQGLMKDTYMVRSSLVFVWNIRFPRNAERVGLISNLRSHSRCSVLSGFCFVLFCFFNYPLDLTVSCYAVSFQRQTKIRTKVIKKNNKGDFFDPAMINQDDFCFVSSWVVVCCKHSLVRKMDSSMSAQASSCPPCRHPAAVWHPAAVSWNTDTCALKLHAPRAKEGGPCGARVEVLTEEISRWATMKAC